MKRLTSPFGWVGGKSQLAPEIINMMPKHRLYVEVFGGALNVLYSKRQLKGRHAEVVNDINGNLVNLHRIIRSKPQSLSAVLNKMLISRDLFNDIAAGRSNPKNNIERAAHYYYLLTMSFGAKGDNFGMNAKSRSPKDIYKSFHTWSNRLKFVTIENMSFEKLIKEYDSEDAFFYCDPPYVDTESYYKDTGGFGEKEHTLLAETLAAAKGKFLVSYNDCELVRELYKGFEIVTTKPLNYTLASHSTKEVREVYIMNYKRDGLLF